MPGARPDRSAASGALGVAVIGARRDPPGRVGLQVVGLAAVTFGLVALLGGGDGFWLCVPAVLLGCARCAARRTAAAATGLVLACAGVATLELAPSAGDPALWTALIVPLSCAAIFELALERARREHAALRDVALTDPLTRVANRRRLVAQAVYEVARHERTGRRFSVVMLDLDGFKSLNDRFGHAAGDDLLCEVAAALSRAMRAQDTVARFGGDEFCVLAPETGGPGAAQLAERIARAVASVTAGVQRVRGSVGVSVFPDDAREPEGLIQIADQRLLEAKRRLPGGQQRGNRQAA